MPRTCQEFEDQVADVLSMYRLSREGSLYEDFCPIPHVVTLKFLGQHIQANDMDCPMVGRTPLLLQHCFQEVLDQTED